MKQITIALFALVIVYPVFACDTPHGNAVATPQTVTDCEYLAGAVGLNEQSAVGAFAWSTFSFGGNSTGAVTTAPITLNGGFTKIPATVDQVIGNPLMATDGSNFLLVEYSSGGTATRLVHPDGTSGPLTPIVAVSNANAAGATQNGTGGSAAVVWDGNEYLVLTTEFVRPGADQNAVPKVVSATVRPDGTLASQGVIADNSLLLTAVKASSSAIAIWRTGGAAGTLKAGFAVPQQIVTNPITLPALDGNLAAAANNGSLIAVVFGDSGGVDMLLADTNFNNRTLKTVNSSSPTGLAIVADGSDFLVLQSDAGLNARATRITGGNPGAVFTLTSGAIVGAASNSRGTIVLSTHGCGTIASQFISRGSTSPSAATDLTLKGSPQTDERMVATTSGHQLTYIENHNLFTQFVDNTATAQARTQLTSYVNSFVMTQLSGGSAVAWIDGTLARSLKVARFDASGNQRGSTIDVLVSSATVNSASIAASGDTLLVAFQETPLGSPHPQVIATTIDTNGTAATPTLLSGLNDDGSNVTAGVNGNNWMIAWRNGPPQVLVVITTPISSLQSSSRRDIPMTTVGLPMLAAADSGNVYWIERAAQNFVHKTVVPTGTDSVIGQSTDNIDTLRLLSGIPVWTLRSITTGETTTSLVSPVSAVGCFISLDSAVDYDTRDNALAMWVYSDGTQLRTELPSAAPAASRHRAVQH